MTDPSTFADVPSHDPDNSPAEALRRLWRAGRAPALAGFVAACGSLDPLDLLEVVRVDQRARWEAGDRVPARDYVQLFPVLADDDDCLLELVYAEMLAREALGERPEADNYRDEFPALVPRLTLQLQVHRALGLDALDLTDEDDAPDATMVIGPGGPAAGPPRGEPFPRVPGFEVLRELGRGGMGVVYLARQVRLNRPCALKMILAGPLAGPRERVRFLAEAEAVAQLRHPNVVQIYSLGDHDGHPYLELEYVAGGNLARWTGGAPLAPRDAAALIETVARAIHEAHRAGIVHRDLKPANILMTPDGAPRVADFGLVKAIGVDSGLTGTDEIVGSPSYMAPEQAGGPHHAIGPAADVYALGAILYELLTGRPPFKAAGVLETLEQARSLDPVPPRRLSPRIDRDVETICLTCLRKEPARRYATALALADDLGRYRDGKPVVARRIGPGEQARKWIRRNPLVASLLGLIVAITAASLAAITAYAIRAEMRRAQAVAAEGLARSARDEARAVAYFQRIGRAFLEWQASNQAEAEAEVRQAEGHERAGWEWDYVKGVCESDLLTLAGHDDQVSALAYTPDGRRLVSTTGAWSGTRPGTLRLWDAADGRLLRAFGGRVAPIQGLAIAPDGRRAATASVRFGRGGRDEPAGLHLWDLDAGIPLGPLPGDNPSAYGVAFHPDGRLVAGGGADGRVRLWDLDRPGPPAMLAQHGAGNAVRGLAFSPDGKLVASGGRDGVLRVWDRNAGKEVHAFRASGDLRGVAFDPEGRWVAASGYGTTVVVWDLATGERLATHAPHDAPALALAACPDGRTLASCDVSGLVRVYDARTPGPGRTLRGHTGAVLGLAFRADGARLATAGADGLVKVHDLWRGQASRLLSAPRAAVSTALAYSPDGRTLAAAGSRRESAGLRIEDVRLWDVAAGTVRRTLRGHEAGVTDVAYSPDGRMLASASLDRSIRFWDAAGGRPLGPPIVGLDRPVHRLAFDPRGGRLVTAGERGDVTVWDISRRAPAGRPAGLVGAVEALAFDARNRLIAAAGDDRTIHLWDADTSRPRGLLAGHDATVRALVFSPDGRWLASAGDDRRVLLWDVARGRVAFERTNHSRPVTALAFSPDGRRLASASRDWSVRLWEIPTGAEAFAFHGAIGEVSSLAFRPDGRQFAAGGKEGAVIQVCDAAVPVAERNTRAEQTALSWHAASAAEGERLRRWELALFHLDRLVATRPPDARPYARRSRVLAELGRWERAEADLIAAGDAPTNLCFRGALRLRAADPEGYRALCREALARHGATASPADANTLAWMAAMSPASGVDPGRIVDLASRATAVDRPGPSSLNTLGAALYRAGRHDEAVRTLERSRAARGGGGRVEDWLLLALAHAKLGDREAARSWHDRARAYLRKVDAAVPPLDWFERLTSRSLDDEATALLGPPTN